MITSARLALVSFLAGLALPAACTSTSRPPIDTSGGDNPAGGGGGGATASEDGSAAATSDAGDVDAGDAGAIDTGAAVSLDANGCSPSNCSGCCDPSGVCQVGTAGTACGTLGFSCQSCDAGLTCLSGFCQP